MRPKQVDVLWYLLFRLVQWRLPWCFNITRLLCLANNLLVTILLSPKRNVFFTFSLGNCFYVQQKMWLFMTMGGFWSGKPRGKLINVRTDLLTQIMDFQLPCNLTIRRRILLWLWTKGVYCYKDLEMLLYDENAFKLAVISLDALLKV